MSTRWIWIVFGTASLLASILFAVGLVYAFQDVVYPKAEEFTQQMPVDQTNKHADNRLGDDGQINIVALGDSLTKGTGDGTGKGYVGNLRELLAKTLDKPAYITGNFAVNGYRTDQLLHDIENVQGVIEAVQQANLIVFTIGGNDLFQFVRDELDVTEPNIDPKLLYDSLPKPSEQLKTILNRLHSLNPQATIVYVGLYNPFRDLDDTANKETSQVIADWNRIAYHSINGVPNMLLVPTSDLFELHLTEYLYSDHFHPNETGYERIAERIVQALE